MENVYRITLRRKEIVAMRRRRRSSFERQLDWNNLIPIGAVIMLIIGLAI